MRDRIPNMVIRTTFIAGFPGETEEEFEPKWQSFPRHIRFDRMGCFAYSQEEDTPAALMPNQIDEDVKTASCTNHDGRTNGYYAAIGTATYW